MDDVQSWWEVPCIAHFCSLFRSSFGLLDFDIEELEEALLTHTVEEVGSSLIQDLIVRLLKGCFNSNKDEITSSNYQMYLRRLFRIKCEEDHSRKNPFNRDVAFHSLPLRTKVEILYDLCDFRLDSDEVQDVLKSLEAHSLRVTALGKDSGGSAYWYFYGTRLYREDYSTSPASTPVRKRAKKSGGTASEESPFGSLEGSKWQVVCFTEEDWQLLTCKFKNCRSKHERSLHRTLKEDFLPELPRLFAEKEKLQRKRMMEQQLRRSSRNNTTSANVGKLSCDEEGGNQHSDGMNTDELKRKRLEQEKADRLLAEEMQREERKARIHLRERRGGGGVTSSGTSRVGNANYSQSVGRKANHEKVNKKRMTNNSMAACLPPVMEIDGNTNSTGDTSPRLDSSRSSSPCAPTPANNKSKISQSQTNHNALLNPKKKKFDELDKCHTETKNRMSKTKVKSSVLFSQNEEDVIIGMHKVIESMKNHRDAWPFVNPVDEDYAPNYYRVISQPMDLQAIEDKLDNQDYSSLDEFKGDFQKIVDNCRKYNGPSSEYTEMVENLQDAFNKAIQRYIVPDESDEDISIEYNASSERKRPRISNNPKSPTKIVEHKKENEPHNTKAINSKSKLDKHDKKKRKQLMRHHSRNSEAMDALTSATAETLKDINKWLGDTPKLCEYSSSSPHSVSSDSLMLRSEEIVKKERKSAKLKHNAVKNDSKKKLLPNHDGDRLCSALPLSSQPVCKDKLKGKKSRGREKVKEREKGKEKDKEKGKEKDKEKGKEKDKEKAKEKDKEKDNIGCSISTGISKEKHHHHHHHHKHHRHRERSHTSISLATKDRSESPETSSVTHHKSNKSQDISKSLSSRSHSPHNSISKSLNHSQGVSSHRDHDKIEPIKKISETLKPKSSVKRGNSLLMGLKSSGTIKRLQGSKLVKFSSANLQEPKFKSGGSSTNPASVYDFVIGSSSYSKPFVPSSEFSVGLGANSTGNNGNRESVEKKKCLLINDSPCGKEGGPRLSLGSVLSTDAIKLGDFNKEEVFSDDEDDMQRESEKSSKNSRFDDLKAKVQSENTVYAEEGEESAKPTVKTEKESASKETKDEEEIVSQNDRKLEPSKGFNRDKCMPNLSAWIKAFGGPQKSSSLSSSTFAGRKPEGEPKSKFKVLGRGPVDLPDERSKNPAGKFPTLSSAASVVAKVKVIDPIGKNHCCKSNTDNYLPGSVALVSDDTGSGYSQLCDYPAQHSSSVSSSKKHRNRKMSNSSLSSQSETGSPSCFTGNDDMNNRMAVINPPRWVDEHWTSQSQSPSASSHVSGHSPAGPNSPFSPPMTSPPRTPQTPPWPAAPVRVGFYQDITSQHSSPEKMTESNSSAASPSTPPGGSSGGSSGGGTPSNRDNSNLNNKNYVPFPAANYVPRYSTSIPSPNAGPGSNLPSPSPGINTNVDSPGSRSLSMGSVGSPHSPVVVNNGAMHASDFRVNMSNDPSTSPTLHHPGTPQPSPVPLGPPSGGQDNHSKSGPALSPVMRASSRNGVVINLNTNPQGLPAPYPVTSINSSGNYMMESNASHSHGHNSPHPENAHVHHHQTHIPQGPPRYAHSLVPAHHQQASLSQSPGLSSASGTTSALHAHTQNLSRSAGLPPILSSSISSSSQPQPSPYPSNPYTSNPRSINVAPNVYNNPVATESRFYKSVVSDVSRVVGSAVTVTSTSSPTTSTSSRSRKNAAIVAVTQAADTEGSKVSTVTTTISSLPTVSSAAVAALETAKLSSELNGNGFQWTHNLASLTQIVNSIPNPMAVGVGVSAIPSPYRSHYESNLAGAVENMSKFSRSESSSYVTLPVTSKSSNSSSGMTNSHNPPEKSSSGESNSERRSSSKSESKASRSQGSSAKSSSQPIVPGSAFNFSALAPDIALYSKDISDPSSLYTASPPALAHHHRPDLYPTSTSNFHTSFAAASAARTTAGGVPTASITPYQIPPFIGSHPSPYQPQSVSSQPFAHSQSPRGIVDPYQQFFQGSPHVMGLLPPSGYPAPYAHPHHSLGFNRPGWI